MKLSILIPTYNRSTFLIKNLDLLSHYIRKGNFHKDIEIVISNNQSKDSTDVDIKYFQNNNIEINIQYFLQIENIGLEKNALFVLKEAKGNFVMYLGDDDYMDYQYLKETITTIEMEKLLTCIIPSNCPVNTQGHEQNYNKYKGRDLNLPNRMYKAGFYNCLSNSWRGHQLSGLVFKREGLIDEYHERNINNIYPFIFMVAYNSLRGKTLHLTQYPLKITVVDQHNKDWDYTADGILIREDYSFNGLWEGVWRYWDRESGRFQGYKEYRGGVLHGITRYFSSGEGYSVTETRYEYGDITVEKYWNIDGRLSYKVEYIDGQRGSSISCSSDVESYNLTTWSVEGRMTGFETLNEPCPLGFELKPRRE